MRAIASTGGLIGILLHTPFLVAGASGARLTEVVEHIVHAVRVAGPTHVAFGTDFDGSIRAPEMRPSLVEIDF